MITFVGTRVSMSSEITNVYNRPRTGVLGARPLGTPGQATPRRGVNRNQANVPSHPSSNIAVANVNKAAVNLNKYKLKGNLVLKHIQAARKSIANDNLEATRNSIKLAKTELMKAQSNFAKEIQASLKLVYQGSNNNAARNKIGGSRVFG